MGVYEALLFVLRVHNMDEVCVQALVIEVVALSGQVDDLHRPCT